MTRRGSLIAMVLLCLSMSVANSARAQDGGVRFAELSPRAERAIDRGLQFLVKNQSEDGGWGRNHRVAHTALSLMAFMVKGHLPERPPYGQQMFRGVDFLLKASQDGGGYMGESMYEHGLATLALSEVWGSSSRSPLIRDALKRAVQVILRSQNSQGGWRYQPRPESADISITVMQIVALASAHEAGILVPDSTIKKAVEYVKSCQTSDGGFGYQRASSPGFARTAAGVTSLLMAGQGMTDDVKKGLEYLNRVGSEDKWFFYGHYYAMQAMYQAGDSYYQAWYPRARDTILDRQREDGSWGDDYSTPMAILTLGVPYRFLPIYQR